jgi:propionyl-CoA carboxylase beta chain
VQILHGKRLATNGDEHARRVDRVALEREYDDRFLSPFAAAERGYVDEVIAPAETRRVLAAALERLVTKREEHPRRRHSNSPL